MNLPDVSIFIAPVTYIICFTGLIILLSMLKGFIGYGVSVAITEWLLRHSDEQERLKIVRWFSKGEDILEALRRIERRMQTSSEQSDE